MPIISTPRQQANGIHRLAAIITPNKHEAINEIDTYLIEKLYKKHGAILFRGFRLDLSNFKTLTSQLCSTSVFNGSVFKGHSKRETIDKKHNIQTVNLGQAPFALHPELAREPWKPDACFFACLHAPDNGGETLICDGVELVEKLDSETRKILSRRSFRYTSLAQPDELEYWLGTQAPTMAELKTNRPDTCPFVFFLEPKTKKIMRSFKVPALHHTMFCRKLAFGSYLLFARFTSITSHFPTYEDFSEIPQVLVNKIQSVAQDIQIEIRWQTGDLLLIDNTRYMHGRNYVLKTDQRRIFSYFGFMRCADTPGNMPNLPWRKSSWHTRVPLNFRESGSTS